MTFKQSILELQHCNKCNSDMSELASALPSACSLDEVNAETQCCLSYS